VLALALVEATLRAVRVQVFQGDKLDVQAKLPGLVLPSVKSNHDSAESSDSGKNNQVLPRSESKIKVF
jgi:hypothetical protein